MCACVRTAFAESLLQRAPMLSGEEGEEWNCRAQSGIRMSDAEHALQRGVGQRGGGEQRAGTVVAAAACVDSPLSRALLVAMRAADERAKGTRLPRRRWVDEPAAAKQTEAATEQRTLRSTHTQRVQERRVSTSCKRAAAHNTATAVVQPSSRRLDHRAAPSLQPRNATHALRSTRCCHGAVTILEQTRRAILTLRPESLLSSHSLRHARSDPSRQRRAQLTARSLTLPALCDRPFQSL